MKPVVIVHRVTIRRPGEATVEVRNGDVPLPVGHVFTEQITWAQAKTREDFERPAVVLARAPICLRVTRISVYGRDAAELDYGYGGLLTVEGDVGAIRIDHGLS